MSEDDAVSGYDPAVIFLGYVRDVWKPALAPANRAKFLNTLEGFVELWPYLVEVCAEKILLCRETGSPIAISVESAPANQQFGIRAVCSGHGEWFGNLTTSDEGAVRTAFKVFVADIQTLQAARQNTPAAAGTEHDAEAIWPSAVGTTLAISGPQRGFGGWMKFTAKSFFVNHSTATFALAVVCILGVFSSLVMPHWTVTTTANHGAATSPAFGAQAAAATLPPPADTPVESIPQVLKEKTPIIPIPGGGSFATKDGFKNFGMTPGQEIAQSAVIAQQE